MLVCITYNIKKAVLYNIDPFIIIAINRRKYFKNVGEDIISRIHKTPAVKQSIQKAMVFK